MKTIEIYCPIASKDAVVDLLLAQEKNDFYFFPCSRYGSSAFLISAEEQVSARSQFGMFRLISDDTQALTLAEMLKAHLKDKTIKIVSYDIREL